MMHFARPMALSALALATLAALTGGCASIRDHRGYLVDAALVDSVQPGVDNQQVEKIFFFYIKWLYGRYVLVIRCR